MWCFRWFVDLWVLWFFFFQCRVANLALEFMILGREGVDGVSGCIFLRGFFFLGGLGLFSCFSFSAFLVYPFFFPYHSRCFLFCSGL